MNHLHKRLSGPTRISRLRLCGLIVVALVIAFAFASSDTAAMATFTVDSVGDTPDASVGDGVCATAAATCTLRAAIQEANATAGDDTINFAVAGTINLTGALPVLTTNITFNGPGANVLNVRRDTGGDYRIFIVAVGTTVNISGLTLTNGRAPDGLNGSFGDAVNGGDGGGIHNSGTLTLTAVAINSNASGNGGSGSIESGTDGRGGDGGGIANMNSGTLTLLNCTVSNNRTGRSGTSDVGANAGFGGGIRNSGTLNVISSTFSGNQVSSNFRGSEGGAVFIAGGSATFTACTITANSIGDSSTSSSGNRGGGISVQSGTATLRNTIIAGNTVSGSASADLFGTFNSEGFNLIQTTSGATINETANNGTNLTGVNAGLGPLANNGGPTLTHEPLTDSPVLDAGDNSLVTNGIVTTDQRGLPRRADSADADTTQTVDIGAVEAHPSIQRIDDRTMDEDTSLSFSFNVGDAALGLSSVTAASSNALLVPNDSAHLNVTGTDSVRTLTINPATNRFGTAVITITATATNGRSASESFLLTVNNIDDAPTIDPLPNLVIDEDAGPQTVILTGISPGPNETQPFSVMGSSSDTSLIPSPIVSHIAPNTTGTLTFEPVPNRSGTATITVIVAESSGEITRDFTVTINAVNDAPLNVTPGTQTIPENFTLVFSGTGPSNLISIIDVDSGANAIRATLSAAHGTLTLGSTTGLSFTVGDGNDDAALTFTGTLDNINAALRGLRFKPERGFNGTASIQLVSNDLGHTGAGGALTDTDLISINVLAGGTLQLAATSFEVQENSATATVTVTRTGGSAGTTSVSYSTFNETAIGGATCGAGRDYVHAFGVLSWDEGETDAKSFTVTICDDSVQEPDETFDILLSGVNGSADLGDASAKVTIKDDDAPGGFFEFSQSDYAAAEGGGELIVNVRRGGNTSQAVSVDYATDDGSTSSVAVPCNAATGIALDRCDFTKALGTLSFAAGETEKSFKVLIGDDSYTEGPETVALRLSNPSGGAVLGSRAAAVLTIGDDASESSGNPIDDEERFVRQHYHDFLNREPDTDGLHFWTSEIELCGADQSCREVKRVNVSAAFFLSIESQETGFLAYRMYKAAYGDLPGSPVPVTLDEFLPDMQAIGRDVIVGHVGWEQRLAANKNAYADEFAARARFNAAFPSTMTAAEFVDALNANAHGALSTSERNALVNELINGTKTRAQVLRAVAEDQTLKDAELRKAFVLMQYFGYLRRNPADAPDVNFDGYNFWLSKLNQFNGNYVDAEMVKAFITSVEYRQRFGQ